MLEISFSFFLFYFLLVPTTSVKHTVHNCTFTVFCKYFILAKLGIWHMEVLSPLPTPPTDNRVVTDSPQECEIVTPVPYSLCSNTFEIRPIQQVQLTLLSAILALLSKIHLLSRISHKWGWRTGRYRVTVLVLTISNSALLLCSKNWVQISLRYICRFYVITCQQSFRTGLDHHNFADLS